MKISQTKSIFGFLLLALSLNACLGNNANSVKNSAAPNDNRTADSNAKVIVQDDVEELGKLVKLPLEPEEATFSEIDLNTKNVAPQVPAPNDKKLVAVLKFSPENAARIVAQAGKYKSPAVSDVDAEMWFPPELVAKSQETGDDYLKGVEYAANDFLQTPYLHGKLTRLNDTNYFVLELSSF